MAQVWKDLVLETSTTTGTGTYNLAGAETGYQGFLAIGTGSTCFYYAQDVDPTTKVPIGDYEIGKGTFTDASPDTLARTAVIASSNSNSAVSWAAGTRRIGLIEKPAVAVNNGARVYNTTDQTISNNSLTALSFDSERYDNGALHSGGAPTKLTMPIAGVYLVSANIGWEASAVGVRHIYFKVNNTTYIGANIIATLAAGSPLQTLSTLWYFAATDYVEVIVLQDTGGDLDVTNALSATPEFMAQLLVAY